MYVHTYSHTYEHTHVHTYIPVLSIFGLQNSEEIELVGTAPACRTPSVSMTDCQMAVEEHIHTYIRTYVHITDLFNNMYMLCRSLHTYHNIICICYSFAITMYEYTVITYVCQCSVCLYMYMYICTYVCIP